MIDYVQHSYYWLPRRRGQDPETGQYQPPEMYWNYVSDETVATVPPNYDPLYLPPEFPRQCLINRVFMNAGANAPPGAAPSEVMIFIDPGGQYYHSTTPPGGEAGARIKGIITLGHIRWSGLYSHGEGFDWRHPVAFNRDAGDKLTVYCASAEGIGWISVDIGYLIPAPFQPT